MSWLASVVGIVVGILSGLIIVLAAVVTLTTAIALRRPANTPPGRGLRR